MQPLTIAFDKEYLEVNDRCFIAVPIVRNPANSRNLPQNLIFGSYQKDQSHLDWLSSFNFHPEFYAGMIM